MSSFDIRKVKKDTGSEERQQKEKRVLVCLRKGWLVQERVKKQPDFCPKYLQKCRIANNTTECFCPGHKCLMRSGD